MVVQIVRYTSGLTHEEVARRFEERADRYRQVPGLLQKYYVHFPESDEHGGIYVWESPQALEAWRRTNLAGTLEATYEVVEPPTVELAEVMLVLHHEHASARP